MFLIETEKVKKKSTSPLSMGLMDRKNPIMKKTTPWVYKCIGGGGGDDDDGGNDECDFCLNYLQLKRNIEIDYNKKGRYMTIVIDHFNSMYSFESRIDSNCKKKKLQPTIIYTLWILHSNASSPSSSSV